MILKGVEASRYCAKPNPAHAGLLIFGADPMRVALRRQEAIAALIGPEGEAEMRLTRIAASELRKDAAALFDAIKAVGFFPGPRVAFVEDATDGLTDTIATALKDWRPGDAQITVTAGGLTAKSALKTLFEKHPSALGCFSNSVFSADFAVSPPAVTVICASPGRQSFRAVAMVSVSPSVASSTKATRGPGKKPTALIASNRAAASLRSSDAAMRVRRISASPSGPIRAAMAS